MKLDKQGADAPITNAADQAGDTTTADTAAALAEHATEIRHLAKRVTADAIEIGRRLTECKALAGHGNWLPWLKREFEWSDKTAKRFMRIHALAGKFDKLSNLELPISGLYALAAPSTPEVAQTEIIERAEAGEVLSVADVERTIKARKKPAKKEAAEPRLNAIGRPYSPSFDPNYRLRISPPSITRLFAPQKFPGFGDARRKSTSVIADYVAVPGRTPSPASPVPGPEIDLDERADAVLDEINAQQAELFTPPTKVAVEVVAEMVKASPHTVRAAPAHATEREILRVDIERIAHNLVKTDPASSRILHEIIVADDRHALAALGAALARGLSSSSS